MSIESDKAGGNGEHSQAKDTGSAGVKERIITALKRFIEDGQKPEMPEQPEQVEKKSCREKYRAWDLEPPPPKLRRKS